MKEVYEVMQLDHTDYDTDVYTFLFEKEEDAREEFNDRVESAKADAMSNLDDDERVIEESETCFSVYQEGYACRYETTITLKKKEVK